jgi:hypothetical protein
LKEKFDDAKLVFRSRKSKKEETNLISLTATSLVNAMSVIEIKRNTLDVVVGKVCKTLGIF